MTTFMACIVRVRRSCLPANGIIYALLPVSAHVTDQAVRQYGGQSGCGRSNNQYTLLDGLLPWAAYMGNPLDAEAMPIEAAWLLGHNCQPESDRWQRIEQVGQHMVTTKTRTGQLLRCNSTSDMHSRGPLRCCSQALGCTQPPQHTATNEQKDTNSREYRYIRGTFFSSLPAG